MREIVIDTETTGLSCLDGHRVVELACVEMRAGAITGQHWHSYFNPERDVPPEALAVHGLTETFLTSAPLFRERAGAFLDFIGKDTIVAHNSAFDVAFLNAELTRSGYPGLAAAAVDTLALAKRKLPGRRLTLDALCDHFKVSRAARAKHSALVDAQLLAQVYEHLTGKSKVQFTLDIAPAKSGPVAQSELRRASPLPPRLSASDIEAHAAFIRNLGAPSIWDAYSSDDGVDRPSKSRK